MRNVTLVWIICVVGVCFSYASEPNNGAKPLSVLLQEAAYQEETVGDVNAAMSIYQQIIKAENARRPEIAKAYYRYGMCLLKKGDTESATQTFQNLVTNYSDQKIFVLKAQKELEKINPESASVSPCVIATTPVAFANDVDPSLDKITVTFNTEMMDGSWSWTGGGETFPKSAGEISYDEQKKTCTRPVQLEPGKVYWVGINSPSHKNFKTPSRVPVPWYIIVFATKTADGKATPIPAEMLNRAKAINGQSNEKSSPSTTFKNSTIELLDPNTRAEYNKFEGLFVFPTDKNYKSASSDQKISMIQTWMVDAASDNFDTRTKAIAQLGNVRAQQALEILMQVAEEPMKNYRPKWMAIRAIGQIGDMQAVPLLIDFVDNGNANTRVYAKAALAEITGVYFGSDKEKWRQWYENRAKNITPAQKTAAELLSQKGWKLWGQRQLTEAEQAFKQATAKDPTNANAWNGLGWSLQNRGKKSNAETSFKKCVELNPKNSAALNGLGWIAKGNGKTDEAIAWWQKAVDATPGATAALQGLADTYLENKQYEKAAEYYNKILEFDPQNQQALIGLQKAH